MIRLALSSALSDRALDDKVRIVDDFGLDAPKTKAAIGLLSQIDVFGKILVVVDRDDEVTTKSFRNLVGVQLISPDQLNTYDVLVNDFIVFSKATFAQTCDSRPAPEARKKARAERLAANAAAMASAATPAAAKAAGLTDASDDSAAPSAAASEEEEE